jgi:membrane fusion protein, multidrug efflux system
MRRNGLLAAGAAVIVAGVAIVVVTGRQDTPAAAADSPAATATAQIRQRDLVVSDEVSGKLGYADQRDLSAHRSGVVTGLADVGRDVGEGKRLYEIDREATVVLIGAEPAYRELSTASSNGTDVRQLERALKRLGYSGFTVDRKFTSDTARAVKKWEKRLKRPSPDGVVSLGDVVFAPDPVRVLAHSVGVGGQVQTGAAIAQVSSTRREVTADLDPDWVDTVQPGATVGLTLPDDQKTTGTVTTVGGATTVGAGRDATTTVPVAIELDRPGLAKAFDTGTVDVTVERSREEDVLTVPVTALLALAEGGYAVQIADPASAGGSRLLGVALGTVSDDVAVISGDGVTAGLLVVVPA